MSARLEAWLSDGTVMTAATGGAWVELDREGLEELEELDAVLPAEALLASCE